MGELKMIGGYVTTAEAGAELGVSASRVLKLIEAERLPATKVGRDWMIRKDHLERVRVRTNGRPPGSARGGAAPRPARARKAG